MKRPLSLSKDLLLSRKCPSLSTACVAAILVVSVPNSLNAQVPHQFNDDGDDGYVQARIELRVQPYISDDDGGAYPLPHPYGWLLGSTHTVWVDESVSDPDEPGVRYAFDRWEDGSTESWRVFTVTGSGPYVLTAYYETQFYLQMNCALQINQTGGVPVSCGPLTPASGWYDLGDIVSIDTDGPGAYSGAFWDFEGWEGDGLGSSNSTSRSSSVTMNGPITQTAHWSYPFHVYDNPFSHTHEYSESECGTFYCIGLDPGASVSASGNLRVKGGTPYPHILYPGDDVYTSAGVGPQLDEQGGDFEVRATVEIFGDPPFVFTSDGGEFYCKVGIALINSTDSTWRPLVEDVFENNQVSISRFFRFNVRLSSDSYSLEAYIDAKGHCNGFVNIMQPFGARDPCPGNRWDFWNDGKHVFLTFLETRPASESGFAATFGFLPTFPRSRLVSGQPGASVQLPIEVASFGLFTDVVSLELEDLPPGYSFSFVPSTVIPPPGGTAYSILTVDVPADTEDSGVLVRLLGSTSSQNSDVTSVFIDFGGEIAIPAVSTWGLVTMTFTICVAGTVVLLGRRIARSDLH